MTGRADLPLLHRLKNGAALLAGVGAGSETALVEVRAEFAETIRKILFRDRAGKFRIQ